MEPPADSPTAVWRKSSRSTATGNECVEVAHAANHVAIRDSRSTTNVLKITRAEFTVLVGEIRQGRHAH